MSRVLLAFALAGCSASNLVVDDAGVESGDDVHIVGTWHECSGSVTYRADGTASYDGHRSGCLGEGTYTVAGEWVETTWTSGTCGPGTTSRRMFRAERGLVVFDPETGAVRQLADDATPHGLWLIEGADGERDRSTTASVVGDPEAEFGSGCYWSTDGECGGLFSCSGNIRVWLVEGSRFQANTTCSGGCACASVVEGTANRDGTMSAVYRGVNCERSFGGMLTVRPLE